MHLAARFCFFLNPYSFGFIVMSCVTRAIGLAPLNAVVFSMVGDVVEFGQWKNHIRQESLIFAGGSIGTKVGAGLASAVITGLLSSSGYVSSSAGITAQPETALEMIVSLYKFVWTDPHCSSDHCNAFSDISLTKCIRRSCRSLPSARHTDSYKHFIVKHIFNRKQEIRQG